MEFSKSKLGGTKVIVLSNTIAQTLAPGQSLTFDTVIMHTGCAECYRKNSGSVILRAQNAIYECQFGANIGSTTAATDAQLALELDGSPLLETTMISVTTTAGDLNKVSCDTAIKTCGCGGANSVTVVNTGTTTINIGANSCLFVKRVA